MPFSPFNESDFELMNQVTRENIPDQLLNKINELRRELNFPEFNLDHIRRRIVRRPKYERCSCESF